MPSALAVALSEELRRFNISLPRPSQEKLLLFVQELERWNEKMNLTALRGRQLVERLVAEPLWVGEQLQMKGTLVDIGSGNGCPAVPLCIGRQLSKAHLIEARAKRAAFLRHLSQRLDVPAIVVHKDRLEDVESFGPVDWITLQAVSPTAELLRAMRPLASSTTQVVWITSSDEAPIASAERVSVPGSKTRIWVFRLDHS